MGRRGRTRQQRDPGRHNPHTPRPVNKHTRNTHCTACGPKTGRRRQTSAPKSPGSRLPATSPKQNAQEGGRVEQGPEGGGGGGVKPPSAAGSLNARRDWRERVVRDNGGGGAGGKQPLKPRAAQHSPQFPTTKWVGVTMMPMAVQPEWSSPDRTEGSRRMSSSRARKPLRRALPTDSGLCGSRWKSSVFTTKLTVCMAACFAMYDPPCPSNTA
jgi:hypothetical protein